MIDTSVVLIVVATFLLAGCVKGVIGLGLPTVSLALLTVSVGFPEAMNLLLVPSLITNIWQAAVGGNGRVIVRRIWPFLVMATAAIWLGSHVLTRVDLSVLSGLLGLLLVIYATVSMAGYKITINARQEVWAGPLFGIMNGFLTGMTGSFVVPGVLYLQALGLTRDMLIQAMGMLFTASTLALAFALLQSELLNTDLSVLSTAALIPALIGMVFGQRIRKKLPEDTFRRVFFIALLILGIYIIATGLW
ncbi:MAG: sulfite exporter TauE/SafE family protein [Rhodospirillales bacterium]|jgi:uncharacterized protein|nr:sulfite exporter TauE/SafE family protein [Rhodospirillales bacterium]